MWVWLPLVSLVAACFFQLQAQGVAVMMEKLAEGNAALRAFRMKMIRNLAYAGFIDQVNFWATLVCSGSISVITTIYLNCRFYMMARQWLRGLVSFFQLQS